MSTLSEQELMWAILKSDPTIIAHRYGQELTELASKRNKRKFNARANELLSLVMDLMPDSMSVLGIVKCWLSYYKLPLDPKKLPAFDRFHENYNHIIVNNPRQIPVLYG
jgi:hypothetical protein